MEKSVSYTGVVLDERSRTLLKQHFEHYIPRGWEWIAHHMTICLGPMPEARRSELGTTVSLQATHLAWNLLTYCVLVTGVESVKNRPHVTLAVDRANGGKPKHAGDPDDFMRLDTPLTLSGVVQEVFNSASPMNESITDVNKLPFIGDVKALGGKIYQVGGAVRDKFLGKVSKDLDIVIQGVPADKIKTMLEKYGKVDMVGASFGVIKFKAHGTTEEIDIAIPRTERKIGAGYTGFEVNADHSLPIEKDLERRDFTINSIAKDLDGNVIDPFKGQDDLKKKIIRVTNPIAFKEDPLRMLRAVQFASRFGFLIEPDTMQMIRENAAAIREISGERILMEFDKIVQKGNVNTAANLLEESGLYEHIFGVKPGFASSYWMRQVKRMSEFIFLMVSLTNLDPDKFFRTNLKGDVDTSREIKALMKVRDKCNGMVECCWKIFHINKIAPQMTRTFIVTEMYRMDEVIKHMDAMNAPFSFRDLAITGDDLIAMGIPQGPKQGEILKNAVSAIFAGKLQNNKEALAQFAQGNTMNEQLEKMRRLL
jgi:hypothetical protein